mgnify:CR=1 FL=1
MKIFEVTDIPPVKYAYPPKDGVNWDIPPHPRYKLYPELQDAIGHGLHKLPPEQKDALLGKYGVTNSVELHVLPVEQMFKLEQELNDLLNS